MQLFARVSSYTPLSPTSPIWRSTPELAVLTADDLPPGRYDAGVFEAYLASWIEYTQFLRVNDAVAHDYFLLNDGNVVYTVFAYDSAEKLEQNMGVVDGQAPQLTFLNARAALCNLWELQVDVWMPVVLDTGEGADITVDMVKTAILSSPKL